VPARRIFAIITFEEVLDQGLAYLFYGIAAVFMLGLGLSVLTESNNIEGALCSLPFLGFGLTMILGLQFKIIGEGVAAGLSIYYNENTPDVEVLETSESPNSDEDSDKINNRVSQEVKEITSHDNSLGISKQGLPDGKEAPNPTQKPSRGPPKNQPKLDVNFLNENIESTEEELRLLRDMFKHAKEGGDIETKERLRNRLEDLLRRWHALKTMKNSSEEE
jgi:hypothetical protein